MNILIVDDHLMAIEGYITLLEKEISSFKVSKVLSCEEAYHSINATSVFDLAIIDYQLPEFEEKGIYCGVDVALLLKEHHPKCKVVMITAYEEATTVYNIHKKVYPDALIIKGDISYSTFKEFLKFEKRYLSATAQKAIGIINRNEELFNDVNREILFYLKQGFKIGEIGSALLMSESTVQKRIAKIRELLNAKDISSLIKEATIQKII